MRYLLCAIALMSVASIIEAATSKLNTPLTHAEAIALMLENNPQLQAADFDNQAAAARIRQQTRGKPWQLGVDLENFGGTGLREGVDTLETTISLGRVFELGDKAHLRGEVAQAKAVMLRNEQDAKRLDLMAETTRRFLDLATAQEQMKLAKERVVIKQRTLAFVKKRIRLGKAKKADHSRAQIDLTRAELSVDDAEHMVTQARQSLAIMWGEMNPEFAEIIADLYQLVPVPEFDALERLVEQNPSLIRFATQQRLADARIRLAEVSRKPDLEISAGLRHFNFLDDVGLVFSFKVPLGSASRAKATQEEAVALSAREPLLIKDKKLSLRSTLFGLLQEADHDRHVAETLKTSIIPTAQSMLDDYNAGYAAGRYSLLELGQAEDLLLQARLEALNAAVDYQRNRTEIDRLTGTSITQISDSGVSP